MQVIDQILRITVDGDVVTEKCSVGGISRTRNRIYDVARFTSEVKFDKFSDVKLEVGDFTFSGFVYAVTKTGENRYEVECRSNNAKLTAPFVQEESTYDPAATSSELWAYYESTYGVSISSTEIDLDFGRSFKREGTPLSAIVTVCRATGATYFDNGNGVSIIPASPVDDSGRVLLDMEVMLDSRKRTDVENDGLHRVIINEEADGYNPDGVNADVTLDVGPCKTAIMYPTDSTVLGETRGLIPNFDGEYNFYPLMRYEESVRAEFVTLAGAAKRIVSVKVDGVEVGYTHDDGTNVVQFTALQRGFVQIVYVAYAFKALIDAKTVGRYFVYEVDALVAGEWKYKQANIEKGGNEQCSSLVGRVKIFVPDDMNYEKGFKFYTSELVERYFTLDGVPAQINNSATSMVFTAKETLFAEEIGTGDIVIKLHVVAIDVLMVKKDGIEVDYVQISDSDGKTALKVISPEPDGYDVVYTFDANEYSVKDSPKPGKAKMKLMDAYGDEAEYDMRVSNPDNACDIPAVYPARVPVDVAKQLGMFIHQVSGATLVFKKDRLPIGNFIVDDTGMCYVEINENGKYEADTGFLVPESKITITAGV